MVLRAIDCGWLDQVETAIVCEALSRREDYTLEELRFDSSTSSCVLRSSTM